MWSPCSKLKGSQVREGLARSWHVQGMLWQSTAVVEELQAMLPAKQAQAIPRQQGWYVSGIADLWLMPTAAWGSRQCASRAGLTY